MILLVILHLSDAISPYRICADNGLNYTSNSVYDSNLNTLLSSLTANITSSGFYSASLGQNPDRANALVLCRGDVQLETCRSCVQEGAVDLFASCPNHKQGFVWSELCMLRYSNESIFGIPANKSPTVCVPDTVNVLNPGQFNQDLRTLINELLPEAANGGPLRKIAAGNRSTSAITNIFSLEQCTPDLSADDCIRCLNGIAEYMPQCCDNKDWVVGFTASCQLRYGTELFYNETRLQELLEPGSEPRPSPGNRG